MPISDPSLQSVPDGLLVDGLTLDTSGLLITARTTAAKACCRVTADPAALSREDRAFTEVLCSAAPKLKQAAEDIRAFADLLRQNDPTGLTPWLEAAAAIDLGGFVTGFRQEEPAVRAAIVEPWSNSPVEGQANRFKLI